MQKLQGKKWQEGPFPPPFPPILNSVKILFELEHFSYALKMITVIAKLKLFIFFSLPHTEILKFCFQLMDTFFHCLNPFLGFSSQSNTHIKYLFLILRNTRFQTRFYMWIVTSLRGTIRQDRYNSFYLSCLFLLLYI